MSGAAIIALALAIVPIAQPTPPSQLEAFSPLPNNLRDLEDRLILRFELGYDPIFGSFSGDPDLQANQIGDDNVDKQSVFLNSNLAIGTRGLGLSTLNSYLLGTARFDLNGVPDRPPVSPDVVHRFGGGRQFLLHQAYGELAGFTREGALANVFIRGGRQQHFGMVGTTFDGGTVGYKSERLELLVRGGRRAAIFDRTHDDPGVMIGGSAGWDFGPVTIGAEVTHFQRTLILFERDRALALKDRGVAEGRDEVELKTTLAELRADVELRRNLALFASLSLVSPELSHARLGASWFAGPVALLFDFDQKIGKDLYFDLSAGSGFQNGDVNATYETFRLNIPDRAPYSDVELSALIPIFDWLEAAVTPGARIVYGEPATRSPFDATYVSGGAGLHGRFVLTDGSGLETDATYSALIYFRGDDLAGTFRDDDMGGEALVHEASASVRYTRGGRFLRRRLLGDRELTASLTGYLRSAVIDSRLINPLTDSVFGVATDLSWSFTDYTRVEAGYELARDSRIFVPQLGIFHRVRVGIEARF